MPVIIVYPPDDEGGRRVRIDGIISGRAFRLTDVVEFLRLAGLEGVDELDVLRMAIDWRGGGPETWDR